MKYYRVNKNFDKKTVSNISTKRIITTLLANELYTENELIKKGLTPYIDYFDVINIPPKKTVFIFGSRKQVAH